VVGRISAARGEEKRKYYLEMRCHTKRGGEGRTLEKRGRFRTGGGDGVRAARGAEPTRILICEVAIGPPRKATPGLKEFK